MACSAQFSIHGTFVFFIQKIDCYGSVTRVHSLRDSGKEPGAKSVQQRWNTWKTNARVLYQQWDSLLGHLLCSQPQPLCSSCTQSAKICPDEALSWPESSNTPEHDQQGGESGSLDVSRKRWIRLMRNSIQSPSLIHYLQILTEAII